MHFHCMSNMVKPKNKNPLPCIWGLEIYNFGLLFLGHNYYIHSLCDLFQREENLKKKAFSQYDWHSHVLAQQPLPQKSWNLQNLV